MTNCGGLFLSQFTHFISDTDYMGKNKGPFFVPLVNFGR